MNTLLAWFNSPEWMIVVKTLLHTLWQAGGFALLLWFALRHAATPATRYRLTLGTLTAILGTTLLTWAVLNQSSAKPAATDFASPITPARKPSSVSPGANFGEPSVIAYATHIPKPAEETRWSGWLALAWLLGTALMLTRAGIQVAGAERLRRSCKPLDNSHITQLLAEAQRALNLTRRIRVAVTDKLTSPAVVGVIVPTLILPLTLLTTLTPEQIRFILLHELAHIRRGDYFANLFQLFIEALLFFNPAVWWISHQVRREREACCDALAIELSGAPVDYARTLLHVAETVLNPPPAAAPAFSDNQREPSSLTDRVQRLLVPGYRPALRLTWRAMLAAIVVGGTLLFLSAVGAKNVVGAVSTNSSETATKSATNVVEKISGKASDNKTNSAGKRGDLLAFELFQYSDEPETAPSRYYKSASDRITLFNYSNSHTPVVQLGTPSQPDTQAFVSSVVQYSDDGTNTQTFQPLETRVFTLDLNKYAAAVRKLAGMPESTPLSNTYPLFGMFLTNAGVNLDDRALGRTFFFSHSRGDVDIRATKDELDAIEKLLLPLAGVPLTHRTFQISPEILAMATNVLPRKTSTILATNPVAGLQALLESFDPSDPRPKRVQYKPETGEITARATEADLKKFEAALNPKGQELIHLVNRSFQTDPNMMAQALGIIPKVVGSAGLHATNLYLTELFHAATNATQIGQAIRNTFKAIGVDLDPSLGKTYFYKDQSGTLFVRATEKELDLIGDYIAKNTIPPLQVNIKVRWVEIPKSLPHPDAWPLEFRSNNFSAILTQKQAADVMKRIERRDGIDLLNEAQLTTLTGSPAQIAFSDVKTVVTGINPKALTKPGATSTNNDASDYLERQSTPLGPVYDVLPTVNPDGITISLHMINTLTEFLGYNKAAKEIPIYVDGKKRKTTLPLPIYRVRQMTNDTVVPDGATLILGNLPTREISKQPNGEMRITDVTSTQTNLLFVLVTPTIIDPAGNPASSKK